LWILIAYRFHQRLIDLVTGGYEATRREQPRLWDLLETLCISRGITMPKLKIMDSDALNAFATGMNPQQYSITVTQGLIQTLEDVALVATAWILSFMIRFALSRSREYLADAGSVELTKNPPSQALPHPGRIAGALRRHRTARCRCSCAWWTAALGPKSPEPLGPPGPWDRRQGGES